VAKKKHAEKNLTAVVEKSSQFCTNVGISNIFVRPLRKYLLAYLAWISCHRFRFCISFFVLQHFNVLTWIHFDFFAIRSAHLSEC